MIVAPEHSDSTFVWSEFYNKTGMPNVSYVCLIGLLMALFSFSGYEAGAHMAEETTHATKSAPLGILYTCIATTFTGFAYLLGLLYAMNNNIEAALNGDCDQPVVNVF